MVGIYGAGTHRAMVTALQGTKQAEERLNAAANDVVKGYASAANDIAVAHNPSLASETMLSSQSFSPERSVVDMMMAETAYKANLEVFKAADDMEKELLDMRA